jgi:tripartite-type tricarboxylate transporter receptor subunit TctC
MRDRKMMKRLISFSLMLCCFVNICIAQSNNNYPNRTVRVLNPSSPGGGGDVIARIIQQELTKSLGQTFLVDNRPGAGGGIGLDLVAKSAPDGYTLVLASGVAVSTALVMVRLPLADAKV